LRERGVPGILICSDEFGGRARDFAAQRGYGDIAVVELPSTVAYADAVEMERYAAQVMGALRRWLEAGQDAGAAAPAEPGTASEGVVAAPADPAAWAAFALERGWSEGLPVVPPTPEAVEAYAARLGGDPERVLAVLPPLGGRVSPRVLAANAILAGCLADGMPFLAAVVQALADPAFNLHTLLCSNHSLYPLVIASGPVVRELGIAAAGSNRPGPWAANARLGRAVRLVLQNCAGVVGHVTFGNVGRSWDVIAENTAESPWPSMHAAMGFGDRDSVITVFPAEPPHLIDDQGSTSGEAILATFGPMIANAGNRSLQGRAQQLVLFGPDHARALAAHGFDRERIRQHLIERYPVRPGGLPPGHYFWQGLAAGRRATIRGEGAAAAMPIVADPADLLIGVAGGRGHHSVYVPGGLTGRSVTRRIG
jgi:hypothetical protein